MPTHPSQGADQRRGTSDTSTEVDGGEAGSTTRSWCGTPATRGSTEHVIGTGGLIAAGLVLVRTGYGGATS